MSECSSLLVIPSLFSILLEDVWQWVGDVLIPPYILPHLLIMSSHKSKHHLCIQCTSYIYWNHGKMNGGEEMKWTYPTVCSHLRCKNWAGQGKREQKTHFKAICFYMPVEFSIVSNHDQCDSMQANIRAQARAESTELGILEEYHFYPCSLSTRDCCAAFFSSNTMLPQPSCSVITYTWYSQSVNPFQPGRAWRENELSNSCSDHLRCESTWSSLSFNENITFIHMYAT